ncbi:hypothetical protein CCP3SC1_40006 [Gammaproteobacteria bacterium]
MERCPACRAILAGSTTCRRCGCELASATAAEDAAEVLLRTTLAALIKGEIGRAAHLATISAGLRRSSLATLLVGFAEQWTLAIKTDHWDLPLIIEEEEQDSVPFEETE